MTITKTENNGIITVKPEGWLDTASSPELGEIIVKIEQADELILDFELVEYMSSAGLRQVVAANKKAKSINAAFSVINVGQEVMNIFKMTGLHTKLSITTK